MRYLIIAVLFLLSLILPGTLFHFWQFNGIKPDLLLLLTIYISLHHRRLSGVLWGIGAGLVYDFYLGRYIGMYTLCLSIVALLANWLSERWYRENYLLVTLLTFIVTLVGQLTIAFLSVAGGLQWSLSEVLRVVFGVALYNAVLVPLTYPPIHRSFVHGWLRYRPKYEREY